MSDSETTMGAAMLVASDSVLLVEFGGVGCPRSQPHIATADLKRLTLCPVVNGWLPANSREQNLPLGAE